MVTTTSAVVAAKLTCPNDTRRLREVRMSSGTFKSWEESYQLQLALALRLTSQASSESGAGWTSAGSFPDSAEAVSHRFWVNGCLSYFDIIPDGFYLIHGMDPYTWTLSTDYRDTSRIPSLEILRSVSIDATISVVSIDRSRDPGLQEVRSRVVSLSSSRLTTSEAINHLASLVCNLMGGTVTTEEDSLRNRWTDCTEFLKKSSNSIVLPIGSLPVGLCVHRALLFKVLADSISLPCRIAKGCKYCGRDIAASCLVEVDKEREYVVDLIENPGALSRPDSSLNSTTSVLVSSPLSQPKMKPVQSAEECRAFARLYFSDRQRFSRGFDNNSPGDQNYKISTILKEQKQDSKATSSNIHEAPQMLPQKAVGNINRTGERFGREEQHMVMNKPRHPLLLEEDDDLDIMWSELTPKEKIGAGSFGIVHRAEWRGTDVAVKVLTEQDLHAEHYKEFLSEIAIMKRLRHPNIVLFMGAVTQPPKLSIVTEYLSNGSLYKLLHGSNAGPQLDEMRRLNMASDVAKGMNYLHQLRPPIVHRDLKTPNLLVDATFTVKVCDFGLSRTKRKTYLSSRTAAGTPEWMAPEVLRNEQSNEKLDVYSFGVILWELMTLQQPWRQLSQEQIIGAVGFEGKRLEIPGNIHPAVASLIDICLANEPSTRPSFALIVDMLQKLSNHVSSY